MAGGAVAGWNPKDQLFLGFDSSTQSCKATAVSASTLKTTHTYVINFDKDLPWYGTQGGMITTEGGARVTSPPVMWLEAMDDLLKCMLRDGFPFKQVLALSGSGQQHGSVYWATNASMTLAALDSSKTLSQQLSSSFAREQSPIWADSSTGAQCARLEKALGGAAALAAATGSRAYERFSGNQISRIIGEEPDFDAKCERVSLVSSFMCSIFVGKYAPIDTSDGAGTNLNDLLNEGGVNWHTPALEAFKIRPATLGNKMVPAHTVVSNVAAYFVKRYNFSPDCAVVAWSGDNPCSLAGLGMSAGDVAISLGTSDTMFAMMGQARPGQDGHVFRNPVDPKSFMGMLCFKNGALAREDVRDRCCGRDWDTFAKMLKERPAGNEKAVGFYFSSPEITPTTGDRSGILRFDGAGTAVASFDAATEARAVVEGKFLAMRHFAQGIGMTPSEVRRIIATGGASNNAGVLQVLADVFGVPVFTLEQSDSASLGAAFRACHGYKCSKKGAFVPFAEVLGSSLSYLEAAKPAPGAHQQYDTVLPHFALMQEKALKELEEQAAKKRKSGGYGA